MALGREPTFGYLSPYRLGRFLGSFFLLAPLLVSCGVLKGRGVLKSPDRPKRALGNTTQRVQVPNIEGHGPKNHPLNGFWNQGPEILGTWILGAREFQLRPP